MNTYYVYYIGRGNNGTNVVRFWIVEAEDAKLSKGAIEFLAADGKTIGMFLLNNILGFHLVAEEKEQLNALIVHLLADGATMRCSVAFKELPSKNPEAQKELPEMVLMTHTSGSVCGAFWSKFTLATVSVDADAKNFRQAITPSMLRR